MFNTRQITDDIYWVGGDDHRITIFENIHPIYEGVSYNAYVLKDEKTCLFDTVDWSAGRQLFENINHVLEGRDLDYLLINHMEPDHGASIEEILLRYPKVQVISTEQAFMMMRQFGFDIDGHKLIEVKEGDTFSFGKHTVTFVEAPMVHWPEAMVTLDLTDGVLFAADAFGSFGALNGRLFADEVNFDRDWIDEARRYYTNIVGKYGPQVQALLGKAATVIDKIKIFAPLHGPVWRKDLGYILEKYDKWSKYEPEEQGVLIVYASMYGNTERVAEILASKLVQKGMTNIRVYDVSKTHMSFLISELFKYSHCVLASVTYNLGIFPPMKDFIADMKALNMQNRVFGLIENGSWAPKSGSLMAEELDGMKEMTILNEQLTILSSLQDSNDRELDGLADALIDTMDWDMSKKKED